MKTAATVFTTVMLGVVVAFGGATAAFAEQGDGGKGVVVTIADIVRVKYQEAVAEAAEDKAEAEQAALAGARDAAEEAAEAAESAREADEARALYEAYGKDTTQVVVYDDDLDGVYAMADDGLVMLDGYWNDDWDDIDDDDDWDDAYDDDDDDDDDIDDDDDDDDDDEDDD